MNLDKQIEKIYSEKIYSEKFNKSKSSGLKNKMVDVELCKSKFLEILYRNINEMSNTDNLEFKELLKKSLICKQENINDDIVLKFEFDDKQMTRISLIPELYSYSVYLPEIFNNGYKAKRIVYRSRDSKSKYPVSKQIREPSRFINKAVSEFKLWLKENEYNATIDCNEIYKK